MSTPLNPAAPAMMLHCSVRVALTLQIRVATFHPSPSWLFGEPTKKEVIHTCKWVPLNGIRSFVALPFGLELMGIQAFSPLK